MKTIMLAAGVGRRLGRQGGSSPKCLLKFNGKSLLARHLEILRQAKIEQLLIVVGYEAEQVQAEIQALGESDWVKTIYNPDYNQGSLVSLSTLRDELNPQEDLLVMDADVLYDRRILTRLIQTRISNCFLLDRDFEMGEEPVKLCVRAGTLVEFRKQLAPDLKYDFVGESVGFFRFEGVIAQRLMARAANYRERGKQDTPYEDAIRDLLLETPQAFGYEDITGLPCTHKSLKSQNP